MKKNQKSKLKLQQEVVRELQTKELVLANGGSGGRADSVAGDSGVQCCA